MKLMAKRTRKGVKAREPNGEDWRDRNPLAAKPMRRPKLGDLAFGEKSAAVYVISLDDVVVKIGLSNDPAARARGIQTSQDRAVSVYWAVRLAYADAKKLEKQVHKELRTTINHARGEWYMLAPETAKQVIERIADDLGLTTKIDLAFGWGRE